MQTLYSQLGKYYDLLAAASSVDTAKEVAFLESVFNKHNIHWVLDVACGTGRHSVALAKDGYNVVGVDYSEELLGVARNKLDVPNLQFVQQNVADLKLDRKFDVAICMWSSFGELPYKQMVGRLGKILNPAGLFIIDSSYFPTYPTEPKRLVDTLEADGTTIKTEIDVRFERRTRICEFTYRLNGKVINDHSEMDMLTEADYLALLSASGFEHVATYYDYVQEKREHAQKVAAGVSFAVAARVVKLAGFNFPEAERSLGILNQLARY